MKDERSKKLYDGITHVDEDLIEAAQEPLATRQRLPRRWIRWAATAACLCLVTVAGLFLWRKMAPADSMSNSESTEKRPEGNHSEELRDQSHQAMLPDGADIHMSATVPMIESFGQSVCSVDRAVSNGEMAYSPSLEAAIQAYGDTVRYRVVIELFRDGVQIDSAGDVAMRELDKLSAADYTTAIEACRGNSGVYHYFTLHATQAQLQNFPLNKELGYFFLLYGDCFEDAAYPGDNPAFNSASHLP